MRLIARSCAALVLLSTVVACTATPAPPGHSPTSAAPATSSAAPSPTAPSPAIRLRQAVPAAQDLAGGWTQTGTISDVIEAENVKYALLQTCGPRSATDLRIDRAVLAEWSPPQAQVPDFIVLHQVVVHYRSQAPAEVLGEVRKSVACGSFLDQGFTNTFTGEVTLPPLTGAAERFAFCGRAAPKFHACAVVLANGDLATTVQLRGLSAAKVRAELSRVAPIAAAALGRA